MGMYYPGYSQAIAKMQTADLDELLAQIDALFGRDNLRYGATIEEVRAEAIRQTREEFTDRNSPEYEQAEFWRKVVEADQREKRILGISTYGR